MRSAKEQERFPYESKTVCFILVSNTGTIKEVSRSQTDVTAAYQAVSDWQATLYAVWPGQWRSDLFVIDDMNAFADAFGIPREDIHCHDIEWRLSTVDDGKSSYAWVSCRFRCGCSLAKMGIKKFALDMKSQKGWGVATSKGRGSSGDEFTVPVSRASLKNSQ